LPRGDGLLGTEQRHLNGLLGLEGQGRAFFAGTGDRSQQVNLYFATILAKQPHQVREQVVITDEGREGIDLAIAQVTQGYGL